MHIEEATAEMRDPVFASGSMARPPRLTETRPEGQKQSSRPETDGKSLDEY